ncbi:MAG: HWE histidine kinase domain-containing protein [Rhizomicrobium sp.]
MAASPANPKADEPVRAASRCALSILFLAVTFAAVAAIAAFIPAPAPELGLSALALLEVALLWQLYRLIGAVAAQHDADRIQIAQSDLVLAESRHRLKNLIAIIGALAKNSRRPNETSIEAYLTRFLGRLYALGEAADQMLARRHADVEIRELITATLKPFMSEKGRLSLEGPRLLVSAQTGGSLALAVHELATNALKYGALSRPSGTVALSWQIRTESGGERLVLSWREAGGPSVRQPDEEGFGSRLIRMTAANEKEAAVELCFAAEGLACTISFIVPG